MSFYIPTIDKCPIARQTQGLIELNPSVISKLAGAVWEKDEWLAILLGEKNKGGLHVIVDGVYVPPGQYRDGSTCRVSKDENSLNTLPIEVLRHVVGVVHSHNRMGAFFSGTDSGEGGLNRNFSSSIVISHDFSNRSYPEAKSLGFDYEAVVTFEAPCGALMRSQARVIPKGIKDWPWMSEVFEPSAEGEDSKPLEYKDLEDCDSYSRSSDSTRFMLRRIGNCGLVESEAKIVPSVFGEDYDTIVNQLPKVEPVKYQGKSNGAITIVGPKSYDKEETIIIRDKEDMDRWLERDSDGYDYADYLDYIYER